jgi:hypothetical protein
MNNDDGTQDAAAAKDDDDVVVIGNPVATTAATKSMKPVYNPYAKDSIQQRRSAANASTLERKKEEQPTIIAPSPNRF